MIVFPTFEDGHKVRPYLFLSENVPTAAAEEIREICAEDTEELNDVIGLPPCRSLDAPVASHPDMLALPIFSGGRRRLYLFESYYNKNRGIFDSHGIIPQTVGREPDSKYPNDILLNFLIYENHIIGRTDMMPDELKKLGLSEIYAKQGYARCSVCLLDGGAITADAALADILSKLGADVLKITPGGIVLNGYGYGFIGGATLICGKHLFFFGNPLGHPDGGKMIDFAKSHGYIPHALTGFENSEDLFDCGGGFIF